MQFIRKQSSTSNVFRVPLRRSDTGAGLTALTSASTGLIISTVCDNEATATAYTVAGSTIESITTLGTFAAPTATKCRFKEVDATNHPGLYEIQLADARFAVASSKLLRVTISGAATLLQKDVTIQLSAVDPDDATAFGISRIDAAISSRMATFTLPANFSTFAIDASGRIDLGKWIGIAPNALASGRVDGILGAYAAGLDNAVARGTVQSATTSTAVLDANAPATDNVPQFAWLVIVAGTGFGQARVISAYTGSTKSAAVVPNWTTTPDNTSKYALFGIGETNLGYVRESQVNGLISGRIDSNVQAALATLVLLADVRKVLNVAVTADGNGLLNVNAADYGGTAVTVLPNSGNVTVGAYAAGQDPLTLVTGGNKTIAVDASNRVSLSVADETLLANQAAAGSGSGTNWQWSTRALANAPAGGGGGSTINEDNDVTEETTIVS